MAGTVTEVCLFCSAIMTHASVSPEERATLGISDTLVRLSVGLEDIEDILDDLEQALKQAVSCHHSSHLPARLISFQYPNRVVPPLILSGLNLSVHSTQNGAQMAIHVLNRSTDNLLSCKEKIEGLR